MSLTPGIFTYYDMLLIPGIFTFMFSVVIYFAARIKRACVMSPTPGTYVYLFYYFILFYYVYYLGSYLFCCTNQDSMSSQQIIK